MVGKCLKYLIGVHYYQKNKEEGCSYSTELKDNDYQYFVEETIKRYLKLKEHENANKKAFKIWNGKCS